MEYEPLHEAGFCDIQTSDLERIFITPFSENNRRTYLISRLNELLSMVSSCNINAEIWIDGSFSTTKPEPNDIDLVIIFNPIQINMLSIEKQNIIKILFEHDICKIRYQCDIYTAPADNESLRSYWRGWFGFSRNEKPKGIFRIII